MVISSLFRKPPTAFSPTSSRGGRVLIITCSMTRNTRSPWRPVLVAAATGVALTALTLGSTTAQAAPLPGPDGSLIFNFDKFEGDSSPAGSPIWLQAVIRHINSSAPPSGVTIELTGNLQDPNEFITSVGFNLVSEIPSFTWNCSSTQVTCNATDIEQKFNKNLPQIQFANGVQGLDLAIELPTPNNKDRFKGTDKAIFTINASGLGPSNFLAKNDPGSPISGVYTAARVQGLQTGSGSTTIIDPDPIPGPDPVPGPLPLLGAGVAWGYSRQLRRRVALGLRGIQAR